MVGNPVTFNEDKRSLVYWNFPKDKVKRVQICVCVCVHFLPPMEEATISDKILGNCNDSPILMLRKSGNVATNHKWIKIFFLIFNPTILDL